MDGWMVCIELVSVREVLVPVPVPVPVSVLESGVESGVEEWVVSIGHWCFKGVRGCYTTTITQQQPGASRL